MSAFVAYIRKVSHDPRVRELVVFCLPALLIGLVLRVVLTVHAPLGIFHDDTPDFLSTTDQLFTRGSLGFHEKKTFLYPLFLTVHCILPVSLLASVPVTQHVLGLAMVFLIGLLCRLWFRLWRWLIIPVTVLTAINPALLWYEHTLMAESLYAFCTVLFAVAATFYAKYPGKQSFWFLAAALVLEAGARPEGKLLAGTALLLMVLVHWKDWPLLRIRVATMLAVALLAHFITRTEQAGLLLYTSVARMTPVNPKSAPGIEPYIADLRKELQARWEVEHRFPGASVRREITSSLKKYIAESGHKDKSVEKLCHKLAMETCRSHVTDLPQWFVDKLRYTANESPAGRMDDLWMKQKQEEAFQSDFPRLQRLAKHVLGHPVAAPEDTKVFLETHYHPVPWLDSLQDRCNGIWNAWRLPEERFSNGTKTVTRPGIPVYFVLGALGLILAAVRRGTLQPFHIAWGIGLAGLFAVIILTANVKPRFRLVFDPFWPLYLAMIADVLAGAFRCTSSTEAERLSRKPEA